MELGNRVYLSLIRIIRISLLFASLFALYNFEWITLFISVLTLFLTFIPDLFERRTRIDVPIQFEIVTVLFIFGTLFLGEVHGFYTRFWFWDVILHAGSAMAFGLIGFMIMYTLYQDKKIYGNNFMIVLFSFTFAISIGVLWEIFEYFMDVNFGLNMQKSGLRDTMWDLIIDVGGAFISSIIGYIYLKSGDAPFFGKTITSFKEENPRLFKIKHKRKLRKKIRQKVEQQVGRRVIKHVTRKVRRKLRREEKRKG